VQYEMKVELRGVIKDVSEGRLRGQQIAKAQLDNGVTLTFDVIKDVMNVSEGDRISILITDEGLENEDIERAQFCGHGYLVESEDTAERTILSLWGILFVFSNKLGLIPNKKYYLCIIKY
jgi:TusA-related sulfurtransferase